MTIEPLPPSGRYLIRNLGLMLVRGLPSFLDRPMVFRPLGPPPSDGTAVLGWGLKGVALQAREFAVREGLPYIALEDGFLRSISSGSEEGPLSVVYDDVGVYYDARRPSRLERLILKTHTAEELSRATKLMAAWRHQGLSKYNDARERTLPVPGPFILVVDQTAGDASISYGMAEPSTFSRMLEAALDEHPNLPVVLKVHPDVLAGRKRAHFDRLSPGQAARVTVLADSSHPPVLLKSAEAVYVVTSQMGFEALIWGSPVRTFGMPFYAGWGLTDDELPAPPRRHTSTVVSISDVVHAALIDYPRYVDPETRERCRPERLIEWMGLQRRMRERYEPRVQAVGFSRWKQPIARAFLAGSHLRFVDTDEKLLVNEIRAVWGRRESDGGATPLHIEDGFLRSVGLGSNLVQPLSWVIDRRGMYYDATSPSDLETLLQSRPFDETECRRGAALRKAIVNAGVTKYNIGHGTWSRPAVPCQVVLVAGQVESDASIEFGANAGPRRNIDLLRAVRENRPRAYIVYKPHPDVVARKRPLGVNEDDARLWCDEVVTETPIHLLLATVDEVHVLTSLTGFEALLRGLPVVCYGQPFYAGWGLTTDLQPISRRTRRLTLEELIVGTLIVYPTYISRTTGAFTTPERALSELMNWEDSAPVTETLGLRALRFARFCWHRLRLN